MRRAVGFADGDEGGVKGFRVLGGRVGVGAVLMEIGGGWDTARCDAELGDHGCFGEIEGPWFVCSRGVSHVVTPRPSEVVALGCMLDISALGGIVTPLALAAGGGRAEV